MASIANPDRDNDIVEGEILPEGTVLEPTDIFPTKTGWLDCGIPGTKVLPPAKDVLWVRPAHTPAQT